MARSTDRLRSITTLDSLVDYLRDDMGWPIEANSFEEIVYDYTPEELGIDDNSAAKIDTIKRMQPLTTNQPWGVFFVEFEPKKLPVKALRRILREVVTKRRASANRADRVTWDMEDLMFISAMGGDGSERAINFAHFSEGDEGRLPSLKVVAWDSDDTPLHMEDVSEKLTEKLAWPDDEEDTASLSEKLTEKLAWPDDEEDTAAWQEAWSSAFTLHHGQVIKTSKKLAVLLADLARDIRKRILESLAVENGEGPLSSLMKTFQQTLVHDLDKDDFADMYAQTIAYGLLSARIIGHDGSGDDHGLSLPSTSPFLRDLMEEFLRVGRRDKDAGGAGIDFDEIGVGQIVDLLDNTDMEAVVRDFGDKNPLEDPVIHFYQNFLTEYDANMRMKRGVFYTPRPVVSFIVRSVDEILRTEFGLKDGLADTTTWGEMIERFPDLEIPDGVASGETFVRILDPATGTGTFLVEVIDVIHKTLIDKWLAQGKSDPEVTGLWNEYVSAQLLPRLYGYELLMAPYAIAHLKVGLKLLDTGYRFNTNQRANIYLTNALERPVDRGTQFEFALPALAHEAQAVNRVKKLLAFSVVVGNPPYSLYSANMTEDANVLISRFRSIEGQKVKERGALQLEKNLQDDYVKFFGLAIAELDRCDTGVLGFISNHGYVNTRSLRGMRYSLLDRFALSYAIELNGSMTRRSVAAAEANDQNVFDIQQGVAIGVFASPPSPEPRRQYLSLMGSRSSKNSWLSEHGLSSSPWLQVNPRPDLYLLEPRDAAIEDEYRGGTALDELFTLYSTGIVTARDSLVIQFAEDRARSIAETMASRPVDEARSTLGVPKDTKDWALARAAKDIAQALRDGSTPVHITYRPFDERWTYYTGNARGFMCNPRRPVMNAMKSAGNVALCSTRQVNTRYEHVFVAEGLVESCILSTASRETGYVFPLFRNPHPEGLFADDEMRENLDPEWLKQLSARVGSPHSASVTPLEGLAYIYAVLNSRTYRARYEELLRTDFPRIPLPRSSDVARRFLKIGERLLNIHLHPDEAEAVNVKVVGTLPLPVQNIGYSGGAVWLNASKSCGFTGIPQQAWDYRIGGYQVLAKWLKSRLPRGGRSPRPSVPLSREDCDHFASIAGSLVETDRLVCQLDTIIERAGGWLSSFDVGQQPNR